MRTRAAIFLLAVSACVAPEDPASSEGQDTSTELPCRIARVVDGDTVDLTCPAGRVRARLVGYDTPETHEPRCSAELALGRAATTHLRRVISRSQDIDIQLLGVDRYGRALTRLKIDGTNVAQNMIQEGLAVPYSGGRRINWCARLNA
ncbi:thermonuclease family protein [Aliiroseovarius marinus]|uniref:thermonuclease family protein n=1 Tax=Aliiroseovarius marinus TaxID=2500159 RepID=UPI003D7D432B